MAKRKLASRTAKSCSHSLSLNLLTSSLAPASRRKQTPSALLYPNGAMRYAEVGLAFCGALLCCASVIAQEAKEADRWHAWQFLVGEWTGEGVGEPGKGTGGFSFSFDLEKRILVRKGRSDYPATKDRPAYSHRDLMIIYPELSTNATRAIYFDNEGHVIGYRVNSSPD